MKRASSLVAAAMLVAAFAFADNGPPLASVWNISPTGSADSSGALRFRVKPDDGEPVDISVPVVMGANAETIARGIRRALSSQLSPDRFNVQLGEGSNVMVSDTRGRPHFSLELVNSDVDNLRIAVQSVTPAASPTVPSQSQPTSLPAQRPPTNDGPGDTLPPPPDSVPVPGPVVRPPSDSMPVPPPAPATQAPAPAAPPSSPSAPAPSPAAPGTPPAAPPPARPPGAH